LRAPLLHLQLSQDGQQFLIELKDTIPDINLFIPRPFPSLFKARTELGKLAFRFFKQQFPVHMRITLRLGGNDHFGSSSRRKSHFFQIAGSIH